MQELLAPLAQSPTLAMPPPSPVITERASLPTLDFPPLDLQPTPEPARPAFASEPVFSPEPVFSSEPVFSPEPAWGSFDLEAPAPAFSAPSIPPPPAAASEPFDHEPSFALEPDPTYHVEEEPVFELEESSAPYAVPGDVFAAPSELSLDEPHDRYLPDEPAAPAPAVAGFDWAAAPTAAPQTWAVPAEVVEPAQAWAAAAEPEPQAWSAPAAEPAFASSPAAAAAPEAGNGNGQHLSDGDVDRIARRLVELLGDKTVRDVAWEVIPDMAEVIIRDRLRELESQVE